MVSPGSLPHGNSLLKPPPAISGHRARPPKDEPFLDMPILLFFFLMEAKGSKGQGCSREQGSRDNGGQRWVMGCPVWAIPDSRILEF